MYAGTYWCFCYHANIKIVYLANLSLWDRTSLAAILGKPQIIAKDVHVNIECAKNGPIMVVVAQSRVAARIRMHLGILFESLHVGKLCIVMALPQCVVNGRSILIINLFLGGLSLILQLSIYC